MDIGTAIGLLSTADEVRKAAKKSQWLKKVRHLLRHGKQKIAVFGAGEQATLCTTLSSC